jgi:formate hydrogenlyase subunit 3/multisubunit Na+/H+ antiporter MnhD subunit
MDMWPAFIRATLESVPDAHSQAPTAGSVLLAGVLLKTGAYGLIRFAIPLFPEASADFAPVAMTIAVIGILHCAKLAFAQTDIKRLIAYTSVSHMGFVLLSVYAWNLYGQLQEINVLKIWWGCYPVSTDGFKKIENSKSLFDTRRRIRGL